MYLVKGHVVMLVCPSPSRHCSRVHSVFSIAPSGPCVIHVAIGRYFGTLYKVPKVHTYVSSPIWISASYRLLASTF